MPGVRITRVHRKFTSMPMLLFCLPYNVAQSIWELDASISYATVKISAFSLYLLTKNWRDAEFDGCLRKLSEYFFALLFNLVQTLSIDSPRYKNEDVPPRSSDNIAIQMKSTVVQTLGALWCARVTKRMRSATKWWAGFSFGCYSWSLASSRRVWRGLTTVLDSTRESIRCDFLCLQDRQSKRTRSVLNTSTCALSASDKMATTGISCKRSSSAMEHLKRS